MTRSSSTPHPLPYKPGKRWFIYTTKTSQVCRYAFDHHSAIRTAYRGRRNQPHDTLSDRWRDSTMSPVETAIVQTLQQRGSCCLDGLGPYPPNFSWGEIFLTVDRMSRTGQISLLHIGSSTYQIKL